MARAGEIEDAIDPDGSVVSSDSPSDLAERGDVRNFRNFRLVIEFDGSDFEGWQIQAQGERTVQGCLREAVERVLPGDARIIGSSRTDSGVHAEGLVASLRVATPLAPETLQRSLNGVLPSDMVIRELADAASDFDARRDARWKAYRYGIWNAPERSPLLARRSLHVRQKLALDPMRQAAAQLVGRRDFACFQAAGGGVLNCVRSLYCVDLIEQGDGLVAIQVEGSGFLRYMVRNIVGTLLEVGSGRREARDIPALIESRDRSLAGPTAAARGLTLVKVAYAPHPAEALSSPTSGPTSEPTPGPTPGPSPEDREAL